MVRFTHSGASRWRTRTVGSSGLKLKTELGNISPAAIWQAKSYIKPLIGAAVLLLQSVDGGIISIWAMVAIHRQKLICSRRNSRQTLHRLRKANQIHCQCVRTSLQSLYCHLMPCRQTYRAHSGTSTMISLTDCLQRSLPSSSNAVRSFLYQMNPPTSSGSRRSRLLWIKGS